MSVSLSPSTARELFERYGGQVMARCRRLLRDPVAAQDACQEVFVQLLTSGHTFRGDAEWMTWLYRVATNVCLTKLRNEGRRGGQWFSQLKAHLPDAAPSMEEQILTRRFLEHMFSECDDIDQQLSVYLFVDGLSQGEAAELLGLSRSTINKRVQALREAYRWMEAS